MPIPKNKKEDSLILPNLDGPLSLPKLDEDDFEPVPVEDLIEEQEYEERELPDVIVDKPLLQEKYDIPQPNYETPFLENREPVKESIDKENKKIIPKGNKIKFKAKDFDTRKNLLVSVKLFRIFMIVLLIGFFILGVKNTLFPEQIYTKEQIKGIAQKAVGNTGFPLDRGRSFASNFLYYYVNSDNSPETKQLLNYFYEGNITLGASPLTKKSDKADTQQRAVMQPMLVEEFSHADYAAVYRFSVLLTDTDGNITTEDGRSVKARWHTFSINVYYDKETDSLAIHPDSPTIIPNKNIASSSKVPTEAPIGNGEKNADMLSILKSTIDGFVIAYSKVTIESHSEIDQYIPASQDINLISGFGGSVVIDKDVNSSIYKEVYNTDTENEWKVDVRVNWRNNNSTANGSVYVSRYVMTIIKTADDVYLVTRFVPYTYQKDN